MYAGGGSSATFVPGEFLLVNCDAWLDVHKSISNTQENGYSDIAKRIWPEHSPDIQAT